MRRLTGFIRRHGDADMPAKIGQRRVIRLPRWRSIAYGMLAVLVTGSAAAIISERQRIANMIIVASAETGLQLEYIEVYGRAHTPKDAILSVSELTLGEPILGISLRDLHARLSNIGWIENVAVELEMPSTIRLLLTERVPIALLQTIDGHRVIDTNGTIIIGADPSAFGHLTVVAGKKAAGRAAPILSILRTEPELYAEVWAISYQSERRWDVHLRSGIRVRLPESDPRTAWSRLAIIDHSKRITDRDLAVIDLRVPNQMIVEPNIPVRGKGSKT
ncbi:MAG: hypothetical protein CMM73_02565 [Rhodospirillaceae bacterium]|nr:hypothetical protein [Rhodospirillaceae bacterium]